jgi:hypothetical protein
MVTRLADLMRAALLHAFVPAATALSCEASDLRDATPRP